MDAETIRSAWTRGRARYPRTSLDEDAFRRGLEAQCVEPADLLARSEEIYLAVACLAGDGAALAEFERSVVSAVPRYLAHFHLGGAQLADLQQELRVRLLTGDRPALGTYSGRASLATWMRVIANRAALRMRRHPDDPQREMPTLEDLVASYSSPDLRVASHSLRPRLQEALQEGFAALSARERTLLRMHFVDDLNIDAIGRVFQVHRSTVGRWLLAIRAQLFECVRSQLSLAINPTASELRSIFRLVEKDLRLSIDRLLAS